VTNLHYYIYVHRRPDTNEVFYVGKGSWSKKKAWNRSKSPENRNPIWNRIVEKNSGVFHVEVVACFFNEDDAFTLERDLIAWFGRKNTVCGGCLANLTDGGEGTVGRIVSIESIAKRKNTMQGRPTRKGVDSPMFGKKMTDEAKAKISAANVGEKNRMFGRKHTDESRAKMSSRLMLARPRAKAVIDELTGAKYPSSREAARQLGIASATLRAWLSGRSKNTSTLRYE
jgi:group I intron endonuclease